MPWRWAYSYRMKTYWEQRPRKGPLLDIWYISSPELGQIHSHHLFVIQMMVWYFCYGWPDGLRYNYTSLLAKRIKSNQMPWPLMLTCQAKSNRAGSLLALQESLFIWIPWVHAERHRANPFSAGFYSRHGTQRNGPPLPALWPWLESLCPLYNIFNSIKIFTTWWR